MRPSPVVRGERGSPGPRGLPGFFCWVLLLSLPFWVAGAAVSRPAGLPMGLPVSALQFVCPLAAALIVLRPLPGGSRGRWLAEVFRPRWGSSRAAGWYAVSVLVVPAAAVAAYGYLRWAGSPEATGPGAARPGQLPLLALVFVLAAGCEEAGWTGYATPGLRRRIGLLPTALLLGVAWAVWHLVPLAEAGRSAAWTLGWFVSTVAARVVIVRLWAGVGSALPAVLCHATLNLCGACLPHYGSAGTQLALAAMLSVVALMVVLHWTFN
ncbi:CPBP family intramembrane glutamic endopeptidase [Phaeacidiphilus oryzae]|uniref:CPBP family intramembrane glutamic endopeptidase n=1 Tax=Phaeacidiphilus oryzae TaxID=348818 RepID=UPI00055F0FA0|nr:CPBP family intramembrane glutamic endopeptidase [Phaeacidiphilus oryzae]